MQVPRAPLLLNGQARSRSVVTVSVMPLGRRWGSPYIAGGRYLGLQDPYGNNFGISFFSLFLPWLSLHLLELGGSTLIGFFFLPLFGAPKVKINQVQ